MNAGHGRGFGSALAALFGLALAACCHTETFTASDKNFVAGERGTTPIVFLDRLPDQPYRRVGIIAVARKDSTALHEFIDAVRHRATAAGCDVVIDEFLLRSTRTYCRETPTYGAPNCCTRKFVCGVYGVEKVADFKAGRSGPVGEKP